MTLNASTNLPGGMTHADYNRLAGSKVEFIRVNELPTSYIKEYPTIYILMKDDSIGIMYEYNSSINRWLKYGGDLGIIPITGEEYDNLSEADKNKDVFYLITDRIAYLEDVSTMKGATADTDGNTGTVPVPIAGDQNKFLRGDGTWAYTPTSSGGSGYDDTGSYTITTSEDGNTFTQNYDDGRQKIITKTETGFKSVSKNSNGNITSETTIAMNDDGSIRSETDTYEEGGFVVPDGDTVDLINDVQTWLHCAEIRDKNYTEISQVISDTTTLYVLMNDENAMKYLARSTDFADAGCADETFMTYLGQSSYVDDTVLNSDIWVDAVKNSPYKWLVLECPVYPFSTASDADLAKMLDAYYNGDITIDDIKTKNSVGDSRSISLSAMSATGVGESHRAQTVEFVIGDFEHDDLATSINGHTKSAMTLLQKDCLMDATSASNLNNGANDTEKGYMTNSKTNSGGWKSCARRIWCNNVYYNALPSTIQSLVKTVNKKSGTGGGSSSGTETTADKIFLASEIEVHGTSTYSVSGEGSQYQYYKNSTSNKYKNPKWGSLTQAWWHRSPSTTESTAFLVVDTGGVLTPHYSDHVRGIAPCLCI